VGDKRNRKNNKKENSELTTSKQTTQPTNNDKEENQNCHNNYALYYSPVGSVKYRKELIPAKQTLKSC
jgi:hypothetical protein